MTYEILYTQTKDKALNMLVNMKKYLDNYRVKPDAKETIVNMNEDRIVAFGEYMKASDYTIRCLQEQIDEAYKRGYEAGKNSNKNNSTTIREQLGHVSALLGLSPNILTKIAKKETYRKFHNQAKKTQWHDHQ